MFQRHPNRLESFCMCPEDLCECLVDSLPPRRICIIEITPLDDLKQTLDLLVSALAICLAKQALSAQHDASLYFLADVNAQSAACSPVERENEHLLASLPKVDHPANGCIYFGVVRPATPL